MRGRVQAAAVTYVIIKDTKSMASRVGRGSSCTVCRVCPHDDATESEMRRRPRRITLAGSLAEHNMKLNAARRHIKTG